MDFYAVLDQVVALLQRRSRVTYNALKLQFHLDDDQLAVLKDELLYAHPQVVDDAGRGLRWTRRQCSRRWPGWWRPNCSINGGCRHRRPMSSSMPSSGTPPISRCCGAPASSITSA